MLIFSYLHLKGTLGGIMHEFYKKENGFSYIL